MKKSIFYFKEILTLADQNRTEQHDKRRAGKVCICN